MSHSRNRMFQYFTVPMIFLIAFAFLASLAAAPAQAQQLLFKLTPADDAALNGFDFGRAVALSDTLALVGFDAFEQPGSAYVFDVTTGQQLRKLVSPDPAVNDTFGHSVALHGNLALVGDPNANNFKGAAYLFDATTGQQLHKFEPSGFSFPIFAPFFGRSVALSGTTALVGAPSERAAYLFDVITGQQLLKIEAPSNHAYTGMFGESVAISGSKALVAARLIEDSFAAAFVFDITSGELLTTIPTTGGPPTPYQVGLSGNLALIGSQGDDTVGENSGSASLFDVTTGHQVFKLTANDAETAHDQFGSNIAIYGSWALIASEFDDGASPGSRGSAYVFDVTTGQQLARLSSPDHGISSYFARSVALHGNTALIGGSFSDSTGFHRSAYLFDVTVPEPSTLLLAAMATAPLAWRRRGVQRRPRPRIANGRIAVLAIAIASVLLTANFAHAQQAQQLFKLTPADAATRANYFNFGFSIATSGNMALIGDQGDGSGYSGSAYLFDVITGQQLYKFTASDGTIDDTFGRSVALSGNKALIGAPARNSNRPGSVYVFDVTTGQQLSKITGFDNSGEFGSSVALSGNIALIGARFENGNGTDTGAAYLFDITTGQQLFEITGSDAQQLDLYGGAVALSGNTAIVASPTANRSLNWAHVFDRSTGQQLPKVTSSNPATTDFGASVALNGNIGLIGSVHENDTGTNSGAAFLFDVTTGQQLFKLTPTDAAEQDYFGKAVALNGNRGLIGSVFDDGANTFSGSAYLFDITNGQQLLKLNTSDASLFQSFGRSVALSGDIALVGGTWLEDSGFVRGAVYVFRIAPVPEPSTLLLAVLALVPMTSRRRRVRKPACWPDITRRFASLPISMHSVHT